MIEFHGEEISENPDEVEPQHLSPNDAMIYHQVVGSCDPDVVSLDDAIHVEADYIHPFTMSPMTATFDATLGDLLAADNSLLRKGDAIVAYAEALKQLKELSGQEALDLIDATIETVQAAAAVLADDPDLLEIEGLLTAYRARFE
jgi:Ca-activated chloride channel family protein